MTRCKFCLEPIAWRRIWTAGRLQPRPYEPARDENGAIKYVSVKNGRDRYGNERQANRVVPSDTVHDCPQARAHYGRGPAVPDEQPAQPAQPTSPEFQNIYGVNDPQQQSPQSPPPQQHTSVAPDENEIRRIVRSTLKSTLDEYGVTPPPVRIEVKSPDGSIVTSSPDAIHHEMIPALCKLLLAGQNVYLHGVSGGGKTYAAMQAAALCGLEPVVISMPGQTPAKLFGMQRPDGTWARTAFADSMINGKVAVLDEFDRTLPATAAAFNSMLENRCFVEGDRVVPVHPRAIAVATGNTDMRGATADYTSAQPLDYSTAARFVFLEWGFDRSQCRRILIEQENMPPVYADQLLDWSERLRATIARDRISKVFAGTRECIKVAALLRIGFSMEQAANMAVWRGLDSDTRSRLIRSHPLPSMDAR